MVDAAGRPFSWGKGYIGMGDKVTKLSMPTVIETNTQNRIFTDIFSNEDSVVFYAPIRVFGVEPRCGPSSGNTIIKIVGTGFVNSDRLRVRFTYGDLSQEVSCQFDSSDRSLLCRTPKFEEFEGHQHPSLKLPCNCIISVTMDGIHYSECEETFKIYSNEITLTSIAPKCGSISGGTSLTLMINID
jgi:IPT/TIG domain